MLSFIASQAVVLGEASRTKAAPQAAKTIPLDHPKRKRVLRKVFERLRPHKLGFVFRRDGTV